MPNAFDVVEGIAQKKRNAFDVVESDTVSEKPISAFDVVEGTYDRNLKNTAKDTGISAAKGVLGLGEAVVGLTDLATGGKAGKALENVGINTQKWQEGLSSYYSPAQQEANKKVDQAEGFVDTAKAYLENPSTIAHGIIETIPSMLGGGAIGAGLKMGAAKALPGIAAKIAPKTALSLAGAAGEGVIGAGASAEQIRQNTDDRELTGQQAGMAALSGVGTSIFGAVGGRLAQKFGFADTDSMLTKVFSKGTAEAAEVAPRKGIADVAKSIVGGGISEGVFEELPQSVQEQVFQNAALDRPLWEGVPEAAAGGLVLGAAMGSGANLLPNGSRQPIQGEPAALTEIPPAADTLTPDPSTLTTGATTPASPAVTPDTAGNSVPPPPAPPAGPITKAAAGAGLIPNHQEIIATAIDQAANEAAGIQTTNNNPAPDWLQPIVSPKESVASVPTQEQGEQPEVATEQGPDIVTRKAGKQAASFASPGSALRELQRQGKDKTHDIVPASEAGFGDGNDRGYVAVPKKFETSATDTTTKNVSDEIKDILPALRVMADELRAGSTAESSQNIEGETTPRSTTYAKWFNQDTVEDYNKKFGEKIKLSKFNVLQILKKVEKGFPLTVEQSKVFNYLKDVATDKQTKDPAVMAEDKMYQYSREGFELDRPSDVAIGDLLPGDEVIVDQNGVPDKLTHKGYDDKGNAILQDGVTIQADPFETVSVIAKKQKGALSPADNEAMVSFVRGIRQMGTEADLDRVSGEIEPYIKENPRFAPYKEMLVSAIADRREAITKPTAKESLTVKAESTNKDEILKTEEEIADGSWQRNINDRQLPVSNTNNNGLPPVAGIVQAEVSPENTETVGGTPLDKDSNNGKTKISDETKRQNERQITPPISSSPINTGVSEQQKDDKTSDISSNKSATPSIQPADVPSAQTVTAPASAEASNTTPPTLPDEQRTPGTSAGVATGGARKPSLAARIDKPEAPASPPAETRQPGAKTEPGTDAKNTGKKDESLPVKENGEVVANIKFAKTVSKDQNKNLYVAHNLDDRKLRHVIELGGLAAPSLAVANADNSAFTSFGDITLLANPNILESSKASVFDADIYSPRYPRVTYEINSKKFDEFYEWVQSFGSKLSPPSIDSVQDDGASSLVYKDSVRYAWLKENGKAPKIIKSIDFNLYKEIREKFRNKKVEQAFEKFIAEKFDDMVDGRKIFKGYTNAGKRRYIPYTLDNILKEMTASLRGGEGFNYGAGNIRAAFAKKLNNLKDIQNRRDNIVSEKEMETVKQESQDKLSDLLEYLKPFYKFSADSFGYYNDAASAIAEGPKGLREAFNLDGESRGKINEYIKYLTSLPTEYFEAKVQRVVQLQEFDAAIVPKGTSEDLVAALKRRGIDVKFYKQGDNEDRLKVVKKTAVMFSQATPVTTPASISELTPGQRRAIARMQRKGTLALMSNDEAVAELERLGVGAEELYSEDGKILEGFASGDKAYIVVENVATGKLWSTVRHEVGVHVGRVLQKSKGFQNLLDSIESRKDEDSATGKAIRAAMKKVPKDTAPENVKEEVLAYMLSDAKEIGLVRRFIAMVKNALIKMGFSPGMLTVEDLTAMADAAIRRQAGLDARGRAGDVMRSVRDIFKPVDVNSKEFKAWFGDSVVTDNGKAGGKPLVVYHGTPYGPFESFDDNNKGLRGSIGGDGFYFAESKDVAKYYANSSEFIEEETEISPHVFEVHLSIKKPFYLGGGMSSDEAEIAAWHLSYTGLIPEDLVEDAAQALSGNNDEYKSFFGSESQRDVANALLSEGTWDGASFVEWHQSGDFPDRVWVASSPTQIKSAISNTGEFSSTDQRIKYAFAGPSAQSADTMKIDAAKAMQNDGSSREDIWSQTGWWQINPGKDGQWTFEIDDSMSISKMQDGKLRDTLRHPALFEAYPFLSQVKVEFKDLGATRRGSFIPAKNTIVINSNFGTEAQRSTIQHEVQHVIQMREGYSSGAALKDVGESAYWRQTGEVEARLVQERLDMSPTARANTPPWETLEKMLTREGLLSPGEKVADVLTTSKGGVRSDSIESPLSVESVQGIVEDKGTARWIKRTKVDSTFIERVFSTPEYYFKKFAAAGRVLQAALLRRDVRFANEQEILGGFVKTIQALRKTDTAAYKEANDYLIETDQTTEGFRIKAVEADQDTWQVIAPKWAVEGATGKTTIGEFDKESDAVKAMIAAESKAMKAEGYSDKAINAVKEARELTNRGFDIMAADMRKIIAEAKENGLPNPFIGDGKIDESGRYGVYVKGQSRPIALFASEEEAADMMNNAATMMSFIVTGKNGQTKNFDNELKAKTWANKRQGTYKKMPRFQNMVVKKRTDAEMRPLTVKQALAQMGDLRGVFFPRIREPGAYVLIAKKDGENPIRKHFDIPSAGDEKRNLQKVTSIFTPMGRESARLKNAGYTVTFSRDESPAEDVFQATNLITSIDAILQSQMATIDKNSTEDVKAGIHMNQILTLQIADIFKSRGYLSSRLKRLAGDTVWEGYETDMGKALTQYGKNVAAGTAKRDTARAMVLAFTGRDYSWSDYKKEVENPDWEEYKKIIDERRIDESKQKNLFKDVRSFMIDVLRNDEQIDRILGTMQGLAVAKFLAFKVSSAAVNLTNLVQAVPATISGNTGESINKSLRRVVGAAVSYGKYRSGKGGLSVEDANIFREISARGWDEAQFNQEAMSELRGKAGDVWNKFMTAGMFMFGAAEKTNRATTIFAAYKAVREKEKTASEDVVWEKAKEISDRAHGVYGKETRPMWARGALNPLRLAYTFQKFTHNYMLNMIDIGFNKKEYKAAAYMLLSPAILAGSGASLAAPILFAMAGVLGVGGDDPEEAWYQWAEDTFGGGTFARHGAFGSMFGINIKGSLAVNVPMPSDIGKLKLVDLAGPAGGVMSDLFNGVGLIGKGDFAKGVEAILPTAFGSLSKSLRESQEGITTSNYGSVFYGDEPLKATTADAMLRFFSFNPSRISGIREMQWNEKKVAAKYQERKTEIYSDIKKLNLQGKPISPEILKEIKIFNEDVLSSGRKDISIITMKGVWTMLRRNNKPNKTERLRAANA